MVNMQGCFGFVTEGDLARAILPKVIVRRLLHLANADPPCVGRHDFFALKESILRRWATFDGHDMQEIVKQCWGDKRDEWGDWHGCGPQCRKCGGTGVFSIRWNRLQRWKWGKYLFLIPDGSTFSEPASVQIQGRVTHQDYGKKSREAVLWLFLACCRWQSFWRVFKGARYCRFSLYPLCNLQIIYSHLRTWFEWLSWAKCWQCNRFFPTWGKRHLCPQCLDQCGEDIPF